MLLIKTKLDTSRIHGVGVFALEDVEAGTAIWDFVPDFDSKWTISQFEELPAQAKAYIVRHGFFDSGYFYMDRDNAHFMNHADDANLREGNTGENTLGLVAAVHIAKGEELTCSFNKLAENRSYHFAADDPDHFWDGSLVSGVLEKFR